MIFVGREGALDDARQAEVELRSGRKRSGVHGIPIAVKDVIDVASWPTTSGSRLFEGHVAAADAVCVKNLRDAGAIIIGKTNLHELTGGGHDNPVFGKVVNPLDPSRGTGGTSSGSAAAVLAGYCVAAIGTDTGGSNRSTAAATGLVGFKPTNGVIDAAGVRPTAPTFDTIGPIAASVEDARLVHFAMRGTVAPAQGKFSLAGLRVGLCPELYSAEVDPAVSTAHEMLLRSATNAGALIRTLRFPLAAEVKEAGRIILCHEFASEYGRLVEKHPDRVGKAVHAFVADGASIAADAYKSALLFRNQARDEFLRLMTEVDALATPVAPGLAPRLSDEMTAVGSQFVPYGLAGGSFRRWANFFGVPALTLPLPIRHSLPASIQISTQPNMENLLFSVCNALSQLEICRD
jgi:aspartyl-tRNA(Asn)/glutamyl-tRNA(Gln) amidotransferase subunit A